MHVSIAVIFHWFCRALFCFRYINSSWNQMCCHSTVFNTLALTRFYIGNWSGSRNAGHSLWQHPIVLHKFFLRNIHIIVTKGYIAQFRIVVSLQFSLFRFHTIDTKRHYSDVIITAMVSQITSLTIISVLNHLFRHTSKEASKLRVTGLCAGNSPVTGEFPARRASTAENVSI